jgi:Holliday junction resolvase RusA-like endonuclease
MLTPHEPFSGVAFRVHGTPAPQGSKRAFVVKGRAVVTDVNPATLRTWREDVKHAALEAMGGHPPMTGPVEVVVTFTLQKPRSVKRDLPSVRPDLDKLVRSTFDALTSAGVYADDSQVVTLSALKVYGIHPSAEVIVRMVDTQTREKVAA